MKKHSLGWVPDIPDRRDFLFSAPMKVLKKLPAKVDWRKKCPRIYDQGELGSCTANAIGAAFEFDLKKEKKKDFIPSRLFIYYNERVMEHSVNSDNGAQIRDGIKSVSKKGVCHETLWPYKIAKFADKPATNCYADAKKHLAVSYQRVPQNLSQLKGCLAAGYPFVFGFTVYESFESDKVAQSGIVPMPKSREQVLGGHAVLAVGYDDAQQRFIVRNSWGRGWGMKGYCTMAYEYLLDDNLTDDLWTIHIVK